MIVPHTFAFAQSVNVHLKERHFYSKLLKNPAKTSLGWLAGLSWFKLEVAGFSWSPSLT